MADQIQKDIAVATLDEVTERLAKIMKNGGFDNASVIWLIKAWTKVGVRLRGGGYHRLTMAYYVMKRDPAASKEKRSRALLSALEAFTTMLSKHGTTEGDYFNRVDQLMRDFVWEYRKQLALRPDKGKSEKEFVTLLTNWQSKSAEQVLKEVVVNMDRHN
jgi:hypothetical protein